MKRIAGVTDSIVAALALAALSTAADLIWARWVPAHRALYGLVHGALLFMCLGAVLGALAARSRRGEAAPRSPSAGKLIGAVALAELFVGLGGAASFYALFPLLRWGAMFAAWMGTWVLTAFVDRGARGGRRPLPETVARGLAAALASGLGFWAISGIWLEPAPGGPDYARNFVSWTIAFWPGFACLLIRARGA